MRVINFSGPRVCPRLMVAFNPSSVCLGSCILSCWILRVSNFNSPRVCPWLMLALTQTPSVLAVFLSCWIMKISGSDAD